MASILQLISSVVLQEADNPRRIGRIDEPFFISLDGDIIRKSFSLAAATAVCVFDGDAEPITTIEFLAVRADQDSSLELSFDTDNDYGTERIALSIKGSGVAGEYGPLHVFPITQGYANYTANFAAGTLVYCDYVRVKNLHATEASRVEVFYGK